MNERTNDFLVRVREKYKSTSDDEEEDTMTSPATKEIEWWNEIRPWTNPPLNDEFVNLPVRHRRQTKLGNGFPPSSVCRTYSGPCPLTFDGAFGLSIRTHQLQLCPSTKPIHRKICLYQHFLGKHAFTHGNAIRLVQAVIRNEDPRRSELFSTTNSSLFNPHHRVQCPLANGNERGEKSCSIFDITRKSIRRHLLIVHQLDSARVEQLVQTLYK